jgi:hypothetical protein
MALAKQNLFLYFRAEVEKLMNSVKQMVYFTIGDFNENFIIREEIVRVFF